MLPSAFDYEAVSVETSPEHDFACPITKLLQLLSAKWTVEILRELAIKPTRTRRFLAHAPKLTMKSLRQRLIVLEQMGFVNRQEFDERPLRVEYSLTDRGRKLVDLLAIIKSVADDLDGPQCVCPVEKAVGQGLVEFSCPERRDARRKV